jgi:hypothetical protein
MPRVKNREDNDAASQAESPPALLTVCQLVLFDERPPVKENQLRVFEIKAVLRAIGTILILVPG